MSNPDLSATSFSTKVFGSPSRYVQGKDALSRLGEFVAPLGHAPLLVADDVVWGIVRRAVTASFEAHGLPIHRIGFGRFATAPAVDAVASQIRADRCDVVIGFGGGSAIDTVKAAGHAAGVRWASVPTAASSDAPCSALSVIYTEDGQFREYRFFPKNPDLVLVDTQVVANAPASFLVAGVGDALATWVEARAVQRGTGMSMVGARPTRTATALARLCWDILWEDAPLALDAVRAHVVTPALENVVEANTLLSGLGFESAGLAAAHAIHDGLTAVPQTHGLAHGQKVNVGTATQLILEGAPAREFADFVEFTTRLGLPTTLTEVGLSPDDADALRTVARAATARGETIHAMPIPVDADGVAQALRALEGASRRVRAERGLPAPVPYHAH